MQLLVTGLFMWCGVHLMPSAAAGFRNTLITRFGLGPYKGIFALLIITSIVLIVSGWRSVVPSDVYIPPDWGNHATYALAILTFILFVAAKRKTNIKRYLRHPQLTGIVLWSMGHLLANGDNRSVLLFVTIGLWASVEMIMINRRMGAWIKPGPLPVNNDVITVLGGLILFVVLLFAHPYFTGIRLVSI